MTLDGSIHDNLKAAAESSRRLKGHPVYKETLGFWTDLLALTREEKRRHPERDWTEVDRLVATIEQNLLDR
jgi:hypothetical protein